MGTDNPWMQMFRPFYEAIPWIIGFGLAMGVVALGWEEIKRRLGRWRW